MKKTALVLTGGGARSAYQVGVLRGIYEITKFEKSPFPIISGFSAGAINGVWLASHFASFDQVTQDMWEQWAKLQSEQIYKTNPVSLLGIFSHWFKDLSSGGTLGQSSMTYLLDTTPLKHFIKSNIDFSSVQDHIMSGDLYGICVCATNYFSGHSTAFFDGSAKIEVWKRQNRISRRTHLGLEHVMASAAIPVFFPPVQIHNAYYGDGMVRLNAPLSPAIHMGADRMFIIGVHGPLPTECEEPEKLPKISIGDIAGTVLNGLFFDSLDADLERLERINRNLSILNESQTQMVSQQIRPIPVFTMKPSKNIQEMPHCNSIHLPPAMRYVLKGIGVTEEKGLDLLSYLTFEKDYIQSLLKLGYEDAMAQREHILNFFQI